MSPLLYAAATLAFLFALYLGSAQSGPRTSHRLLASAFALMGLQFLLSVLQFSAPDHWLIATRSTLAMALPPLLYLHLHTASRETPDLLPVDAVHLAAPAFMILIRLAGFEGWYIDGTILLGLLLYIGLIVTDARDPARDFEGRGPQAARSLRRWRWMIILWLGLTAVADTWISLEISSAEALQSSIGFALATAGLLGFFAYALVSTLHRTGPMAWVAARVRVGAEAVTPTIADRIDQHMRDRQPYLDETLTLPRLARQLGEPQRLVSETINTAHGINFSQWLQTWRVEHAKRVLIEQPEAPLLDVLHDSGFQSKSAFNKAFKDLTGETPSAWRKANLP